MSDIYFKNYNKKNNHDTGKIPLTRTEKDFQDRINDERYNEIVRRQKRNAEYDDEYTPKSKARQNSERTAPFPDSHEKKKKKKRGCGCGTFIIAMLLIIAILSVGCFGYVYSLCSKVNYVKPESYSAAYDPDYYNVLLIGCDKYDGTAQRSDSMILVSIDKTTQKIKFTSFMRDMWVSIPGYESGRLNAAYAYGGAELLMETISTNFGININGYVTVDFEMFKQVIDGLGGVTVDITEKEANFINRTSHAEVHAGENLLDGDYALIYCRIRYLDSDFNRTQRQRKVMTSILKKMASQNPIKSISVMKSVLPLVTSGISPFTLTIKAFGALKYIQYETDQLRLPIDGGYTNQYINGQDVLVPDKQANAEALQNFIYESN